MNEDPVSFQVLSALVLVAILVFVFLLIREPWRRTEFGRSLMSMSVGIAMFATLTLLRTVFGDYPGRESLRLVAYSLILYAVIGRTRTLWILQRRDDDDGRRDNRRGSDNEFN